MNPTNEQRLINNRIVLQNEIVAEDFLDKMVTRGGLTAEERNRIRNVLPCTRQMKAELFVSCLIKSGNEGYHVFCTLLNESNDNRYKQLLDRLQHTTAEDRDLATGSHGGPVPIPRPGSSGRPNSSISNASSGTSISTRSLPSRDGETGERNLKARRAWRSGNSDTESLPPSSGHRCNRPDSTGEGAARSRPDSTGERRGMARASSTGETTVSALVSGEKTEENEKEDEPTNEPPGLNHPNEHLDIKADVDMQTLEKELVRIAPTIADLFKKITKSKPASGPVSEDELERIKGENERLRKTNRTLIEKLNTFQQKIIQLQLENKKLRENGEVDKSKSDELQQKSVELEDLEKRLEDQKRALEEKEEELNAQLQKIKEIEKENEKHKKRIGQLEILHEEGELARLEQQSQIEQLEDDKDHHRKQITVLEEKQRIGEERLWRLEERLKMLEQGTKTRRRGTRIMSPTRTNPWMSGVIDRSHHANVKFNPPSNSKKATGSSWSF